jgi:uncharacterized peroxidase-related enzyme
VPHIQIDNDLPGITGLLKQRPDTGGPMGQMAEALLRGPLSLTQGERELIAAYTSERNETPFCSASHSAFAAAQLEGGYDLVKAVLHEPETAPITPLLKSLLRIAAEVQGPVKAVSDEAIAAARAEGADDAKIHDTVLVAAAFCMINRYVTCLDTELPKDPGYYDEGAKRILGQGYAATLT